MGLQSDPADEYSLCQVRGFLAKARPKTGSGVDMTVGTGGHAQPEFLLDGIEKPGSEELRVQQLLGEQCSAVQLHCQTSKGSRTHKGLLCTR